MIWTIDDRFSKHAYFIPCKKTMSAPPQVAKLFINNIFPHHGFPKVMLPYHDRRFCNHFWVSLFKNLETKMEFTYAFHPKSNGQSEAIIISFRTFLDLAH